MLLRLAQGSWPPFASCLPALKARLENEQLGSETIDLYLYHARQFLAYLDRRQTSLERATPKDLETYIAERLSTYRKERGHSPHQMVKWRCSYTAVIHRLLRDAQGQWPPPLAGDADLQRFEAHLLGRGRGRKYVQACRRHARPFIDYLNQRSFGIADVRPADVAAYFRIALEIYRKLNPKRSNSAPHMRAMSHRAVYGFLRFARGKWPPESGSSKVVTDFRTRLERYRYSRLVIPAYASRARQFLDYLEQEGIPLEQAGPQHVDGFTRMKLERYERRNGSPPDYPDRYRSKCSGAIRLLLRMLSPGWPLPEPPANDREQFQREVLDGYVHWLVGVHGLAPDTGVSLSRAARVFLDWLGDEAARESLVRLGVSAIDRFLAWRMQDLRRATRQRVSNSLRSFLRYLHEAGFIPKNLAVAVAGPMLYKFEEIPRAFTQEQVKTLLDTTRRDKTPCGLRDHAILMLLATYGLRAGEVVRLRLDDIDWRGEKFRVRQSKTGNELVLPLLSTVGEALLKYLRNGRPKTEIREVFLRARAPLGAFKRGSSLHVIVQERLKKAGVKVQGRHGPHAFRFARAGSLLRAGVALKPIGDLLGHRSAASTEVYLRLATEDLRAISIDVPGIESHA
jgi:integrase/recombinase XerD